METILKPRLLEKSVGSYKERMSQQNLSPEEERIVSNHTFNLQFREYIESVLLFGGAFALMFQDYIF